MIVKCFIHRVVLSVCSLALLHCSFDLAGTATQTDNAITGTATQTDNTIAGVVTNEDGTFAANVEVTLRTASYLPDSGSTTALALKTATVVLGKDCSVLCKDTTDINGAYTLNQPDTTYSLEFRELSPISEIIKGFVLENIIKDTSDVIKNVTILPTQKLTYVIPDSVVHTMVWVAGTMHIKHGAAGDTLTFAYMPQGERTIILIQQGVGVVLIEKVTTGNDTQVIPGDVSSSSVVVVNVSSEDTLGSQSGSESSMGGVSSAALTSVSSQGVGVSSLGDGANQLSSSSQSEILSSSVVVVDPIINAKRIYVSELGNDANEGSIAFPVRNIYTGLDKAVGAGAEQVWVAGGTYSTNAAEHVNSITITDGIDLLGGWSNDFSERDLSFSTYQTRITGKALNDTCNYSLVVAQDVMVETVFEGFILENNLVCDIGGAGLYVNNSSEKLVVSANLFDGNRIVITPEYQGSENPKGGNVLLRNSAPKFFDNQIKGGRVSNSLDDGGDAYIDGNYFGVVSEFAYNDLSSMTDVKGTVDNYFHHNSWAIATAEYFVAPFGKDSLLGFSASQAVETIARGIALSGVHESGELRIAIGTYLEKGLVIPDGLVIRGGYSTDFQYRHRVSYSGYEDTFLSQSNRTIINAGQPEVDDCTTDRVISIDNNTLPTLIDGLVITGGRVCGSGGGMFVTNSDSNLVIRHNHFYDNVAVTTAPTNIGGNIAIRASAPKIIDNKFTGGQSGLAGTEDFALTEVFVGGALAEITYNIFTSTAYASVSVSEYGNMDISFSSIIVGP